MYLHMLFTCFIVSSHKKSKDSQTGEKPAVTPPGPLPAVLKVAENIKVRSLMNILTIATALLILSIGI